MITLENYYKSDADLTDLVEALGDPNISPTKHRDGVNRTVLNVVTQYTALYTEADPKQIKDIRPKLEQALSRTANRTEEALHEMITNAARGNQAHPNDSVALISLADTRSTAAIFKEIAFNDRFEGGRRFTSVDLGTGSGILMLASAVAGMRKGCKELLLYGFDVQEQAVLKARRILNSILKGKNLNVQVVQEDILNPRVIEFFKDQPISHLTSETISSMNCPLILEEKGVKMKTDNQAQMAVMSLGSYMNRYTDPFPSVLDNILKYRPSFKEDVLRGKTAMFPDIINGDYVPELYDSKIRLRHGKDPQAFLELYKAGAELASYEPLSDIQRWRNPKDLGEDDLKTMIELLQKNGQFEELMNLFGGLKR